MQSTFARSVIRKVPLAEAVLLLWQHICEAEALDRLFAEHRGAGYERVLKFSVMVNLVADALLEHAGSGRQSFQRGRENAELVVTLQAAYQKLGRLPLSLSQGFLAESTTRLREVFPQAVATNDVPASLQEFAVVAVDGKAIKQVPKRLKPLRSCKGGVLGGKALVALEMKTGLALAMAADEDGDANDSRMVAYLLPQVREQQHILWLGDRQFCDPAQACLFCERVGDHFLLRYHKKNPFFRDAKRTVKTGTDSRGRKYQQEWGVLGAPRNKRRRTVRCITLYRPGEEGVILVTDLLDDETYPAEDLLEMYLARWGIERVFQKITEVFSLQHLIGTTPRGTLFQLAFCLLLYNLIQVLRAYVAEGAEETIDQVSTELLFDDVKRQLISVHTMLPADELTSLLDAIPTPEQLRHRLMELLHAQWTERWRKSPPKKRRTPHPKTTKREHSSAYRVLQEHRLAKIKNKNNSK